jgi:hypothetical protein
MSDEELVKRLRERQEFEFIDEYKRIEWEDEDALEAADRIEALTAERAKAVEALRELVQLNDDYSPFGGEMFQDRVNRTWDRARATLAEIEGAKG